MRVRPLSLLAVLAIAAAGLVVPGAAHAAPVTIDLDAAIASEVVNDTRAASPWTSSGWTNSHAEHPFVAANDSRDLHVSVGVEHHAGNRIEAVLHEGPIVGSEPFGSAARYGTAVGSGSFVATGSANAYVDIPLGLDSSVVAGQQYVLVVKYLRAGGSQIASWRYGPIQDATSILIMSDVVSSPTAFPPYVLDLAVLGVDDPIALKNTGTAGDDGWFVGPVTSTYTCVDGTTGCPEVRETSTDGEHAFTGSVTFDSVEYAWTHSVKVDQTAPTVTGELVELQEGDPEHGFRVAWTCEDETSGVVECPEGTVVTGLGDDTSASVEVSDVAGNTITATMDELVAGPFLPTITFVDAPDDQSTHDFGTELVPTCTAVSTVPGADGDVSCAVELDDVVNDDDSATWTATATAVDESANGGTTTDVVSWTVEAPAPVVTETTPSPSPSPSADPEATPAKPEPKTVIKVRGLKGLPKRAGVPVLAAGEFFKIKVRVKSGGKLLKGRPVWLHSVKTNKAGTKGKPRTKASHSFTKAKKNRVWVKTFVPTEAYSGQYRKFGVRAKDGTVRYVTVYVK